MTDGKISQALQDAEITREITCPQAFVVATKAQVSPEARGGYCTSHRIKIRGYQSGCFT